MRPKRLRRVDFTLVACALSVILGIDGVRCGTRAARVGVTPAHAASPPEKTTADCKGWFGWKADCLADLLADERYFHVQIPNEKLPEFLQYVRQNDEKLAAQLDEVDYGRKIEAFVYRSGNITPGVSSGSLSTVATKESVDAVSLDLVTEFLLEVVQVVYEIPIVHVLSESIQALQTIKSGLQVLDLGRKVYLGRGAELRTELSDYFLQRLNGKSSDEAWGGTSLSSDAVDVLMIWCGGRHVLSGQPSEAQCLAEGREWFERVFAAYRMVQVQWQSEDSARIRRAMGVGIARLAIGGSPSPVPVPVRAGRPGGLGTALVLDVSGSMEWASGAVKGKRKIDLALEAARVFAKGAKEDEQISLSTFASGGATPVPMARKQGAIDGLPTVLAATGGTNIGAGLDQAEEQLRTVEDKMGKKIALLLSDGVNNIGDWRPTVERFRGRKWKIYTIGFLTDEKALEEARKQYGPQIVADDDAVFSKTLFEIALRTRGIYYPAASENVEHIFDRIRNLVSGESSLLYASEWLKVGEELAYRVRVSERAEVLRIFVSTLEGELGISLGAPDGSLVRPEALAGRLGQYQKGNPFQIVEVNNPQKGTWLVKVKWAQGPPSGGGQVNLSATERSDVVANLLAFRPVYGTREPVGIAVYTAEGDEELPLLNARVTARIRKPGPEIVQAVQAGTGSWVMYKDVVQNNTRELILHDDGQHDDYAAADGIYGATFLETDVEGPYIITVEITRSRRDGTQVMKVLQGTFQVGPIVRNRITVSRELEWLERLGGGAQDLRLQVEESPRQPAVPKGTENLLEQPAKTIESLIGDPQKEIEKLLGK